MFRHVLSFIGVASTCSLFAFAAPVPVSAHELLHHQSFQQQFATMRHDAFPMHHDALQYPAASACTPVVVQAGDTLSQIATVHDVTWPYLATLNHIPDPNLIFPAQVFQVCGTATASTVPAAIPAASGATRAATPAPVRAPVTHKTAVPAPSYAAASGAGNGSVQNMIRSVFGAYANQALTIAACESGYNPGATNRSSGAAGVFQFLHSTWAYTPYAGSSPYNASANIEAAHWVFVKDGYSWREWSCRA